MKRLICLFLILCMVPVFSLAEDLSSMSYDDLVTLNKKIVAEIMSRPEWKEVEVPAGSWRVGDQIPAGVYSLKSKGTYAGVTVWRESVDTYSNNGLVYNEILRDDAPCGRIVLQYGFIFVNSQPVIFAPPMTLGF